jgi:GNAT superfamily N-acetyltransferase
MIYRTCTIADAALLAGFNQRLIQDEGHRNRMSLDELEERMRSWLGGEYEAVLIEDDSEAVGYALFARQPDHIYLRQFFVTAERRRKGIGRAAIEWLLANTWNGSPRIRLDVLTRNAQGIEFWKTLGFSEYCITMERDTAL